MSLRFFVLFFCFVCINSVSAYSKKQEPISCSYYNVNHPEIIVDDLAFDKEAKRSIATIDDICFDEAISIKDKRSLGQFDNIILSSGEDGQTERTSVLRLQFNEISLAEPGAFVRLHFLGKGDQVINGTKTFFDVFFDVSFYLEPGNSNQSGIIDGTIATRSSLGAETIRVSGNTKVPLGESAGTIDIEIVLSSLVSQDPITIEGSLFYEVISPNISKICLPLFS